MIQIIIKRTFSFKAVTEIMHQAHSNLSYKTTIFISKRGFGERMKSYLLERNEI